MRNFFLPSRLILMVLAASGTLLAQDPRGTLTGRIFDSTGAIVPGATVVITSLDTGTIVHASSNERGAYEAPYLLPGAYRITVEHPGFKTWTQPRAVLRTGDRLALDITLEVGAVTETVEVSARAAVLESTTATIAQVIGTREVSELPLRNGSVGWMFAMAPGVILPRVPRNGPWATGDNSQLSVAGSGTFGMDYNLDGVSNNSVGGQISIVPPADTVQEVQVITSSYDAAVGHTTGGSVNISLKAGTGKLHGTLGFSGSGGPLMTRDFFLNQFLFDPGTGPVTPEKIARGSPAVKWLRYNATASGPVYLPGIYEGRQKTFWMFGFQGHNKDRSSSSLQSVPTPAQREGDFSALLAIGPQYQIYDPLTTVPFGATRFRRSPFADNRIPASRIDPVARRILKYFPDPNTAGSLDGTGNYSVAAPDTQNLYQPLARLDHNFNERHRFFGRYSQSIYSATIQRLIPGSDVKGRDQSRPHRGVALDDVYTLSPAMVLDVRYGFNQFSNIISYRNEGWDLGEFGFPPSLLAQLGSPVTFPSITISGLMALGNDSGYYNNYYSHSLLTVLNRIQGSHSLRMGVDLRLLRESNLNYGNVSPALSFAETYTRGPLDNSPAAPMGQGLASFLLGIPTGGGVDVNDSSAEATGFYSGFFQDDWRVSRPLTLNVGLRYEYESPLTERFNRTTRDFDFAVTNPIEGAARARYAKAPLPQLPVAAFRTVGGVTFAGGVNPRGVRDPYYRALMPRFGLAWHFGKRAVLRGGYGIFFALLGSEFSNVKQPGFSQRTNVIPTLDNGQTYVASISNPLPFGIERPRGAAGGLRTFLGRSPGFFAADGRRPYTQRWSLSLQFAATRSMVVEAGYIGSRAVRQSVSTEFDPTPRWYLSASPERDQPVIDFLSGRAANPFLGIAGFEGSPFYAEQNTTHAQLLKPYPHFTSLATGLPAGSSWYHGMILRAERRMAAGLHFNAHYTWSKNMEAASYLNDTDSVPEHVISELDRPHRLSVSAIYELPFGAGRPLGASARGLRNHLIGGWNLQVIYQAQSGAPLAFGNVLYRGEWREIATPKPTLYRWFNTDGFERDKNRQLAFNIRTFPSRIPWARSDGINLWDIALHKNFGLREGLRLQIRAEAEGAMNHPMFDPPNTVPTSTVFGQVRGTQTGSEPRSIFLGAKLIF